MNEIFFNHLKNDIYGKIAVKNKNLSYKKRQIHIPK